MMFLRNAIFNKSKIMDMKIILPVVFCCVCMGTSVSGAAATKLLTPPLLTAPKVTSSKPTTRLSLTLPAVTLPPSPFNNGTTESAASSRRPTIGCFVVAAMTTLKLVWRFV